MELLFILIFISNLLSIIVGEDQYIAIPFDSKPITINVTNQDNIFLYFTLEFEFYFHFIQHFILIQILNITICVIS